jgi:hypothetical protein
MLHSIQTPATLFMVTIKSCTLNIGNFVPLHKLISYLVLVEHYITVF